MDHYILGVDIGSTHTDAVVINKKNKRILALYKAITTRPFLEGYINAVSSVVQDIDRSKIERVHIGTTHAINALLEMKGLNKVGVLNLAGHNPQTLPTGLRWAQPLKDSCYVGEINIPGGNECNGAVITSFNSDKVLAAINELLSKKADAIAVVGTFSPLFQEQELEVGNIIEKHFPNIFYTLSHQIGSLGIIERKNATVLNCALGNVLKRGFLDLKQSLYDLKILSDIYLCKNNGTLMDFEEAINFPICTIASGPTNSFIGASYLVGEENCVVVDVGGTSTDCGVVLNGRAKKSTSKVEISGASLNFSMPDVTSIPLGGGTRITLGSTIEIGPQSVGYDLKSQSQSFGGKTLTLTDIALSLGHCEIPDSQPPKPEMSFCEVMKIVMERVNLLITKVRGFKFKDFKVVCVGGGAALLDKKEIKMCIPEHYMVANAYGAALAELAATFDAVMSLDNREKLLTKITKDLATHLQKKGVKKSRVIEKEIIPFSYIPGNLARIIVTVAGM